MTQINIIGERRAGMSYAAVAIAARMNSHLFSGARCLTPSEVLQKLKETDKGAIMIMDERGCPDGRVRLEEVKTCEF